MKLFSYKFETQSIKYLSLHLKWQDFCFFDKGGLAGLFRPQLILWIAWDERTNLVQLEVCPDDATLPLGQGTVPPWNIVPRCPRVLQVLPTMSGSSQVSQLSQSQLPDIVGSPCNTLGQRGTRVRGDTVPCPNEKSCIVWTDLKN